jgi:hypothetical protein
MAFNDHFLKYQYPGTLTGKISDFCGVFYFPIFLLALFHLLGSAVRGPRAQISRFQILLCILITDLIMLGLKLSPVISERLTQFFSANLFPIQTITDPWDLIALSMNVWTYWFVVSRVTSSNVT